MNSRSFFALDGIRNFVNLEEVIGMKKYFSTKKIAALVAAIALVGTAQSAYALRTLTEAEKMAVIAEYLAEREAKEAAKAPEPAPEVKAEAPKAEAEPLKVTIEVTKVEAEKPAETPKVEAKVAEVKTEKVETKAEPAPASADVVVKVEEKPIITVTGDEHYGSGPRPEGADQMPACYADVPFFTKNPTVKVEGKVKVEVDATGEAAYVVLPNRGVSTKVKELTLKELRVPGVKDGKAVWRSLPTPANWGKSKAFNFDAFETVTDFLLMRKFGVVVTQIGVDNINEAIRGHAVDKPIKTVMVLENPMLDDEGRISGYRALYNVRESKPIYVVRETDYDGLAYWIRMRVPVRVAQGLKGQIHHRSAKVRKVGYEACDNLPGEEPQCYLTLMYGVEGDEARRPGREGLERSIPFRDLVPLDADEMAAAAKAATAK